MGKYGMCSCEKCQFHDYDYIWDEKAGEEYPIYICEKGNDTDCDFEYKDFKEHKPKTYKEEDTECDKCKYRSKCEKDRMIVDIRSIMDARSHYIKGLGCHCRKKE